MKIIDETINVDDNKQEDTPVAREIYKFSHTADELRQLYKITLKLLLKRPIIFTLIAIPLSAYIIYTTGISFSAGFLMGMFFLAITLYAKNIVNYKKARQKSQAGLVQNTYEYEVYDGYFIINVYRNDELVRKAKIPFSEIERVYNYENHLAITVSDATHILKKSVLNNDSAFYRFIRRNPTKVTTPSSADKRKIFSVILFVASLLSILGALICSAALTSVNHTFDENLWVFFLFTPIPVASIVLGYYLKSKGYKYKKNIVVGFIITPLLCIYGSMPFITESVYTHTDEHILEVEQYTGIDFPTPAQINNQEFANSTQTHPNGRVYYTSDVYFDDEAVESFESQILNDERWMTYIPNDIVGIISSFTRTYNYDFVLVYNTDNGEFNTVPSEEGTYHFITITYESQTNKMQIVEYDLQYLK